MVTGRTFGYAIKSMKDDKGQFFRNFLCIEA